MLKRHNLLIIKDNPIPGIVKRQESLETGTIEVGFSYPIKIQGQRVREISRVKLENIEKKITPYEVLDIYRKGVFKVKAFDELIIIAEKYGLEMGIFGSLALQVFTGLDYFGQSSDIDIIIKKNSDENIRSFYECFQKIEHTYKINIDIEMEIDNGYSLKLKEYFKGQKTILLKGICDVKLVELNTLEENMTEL